MTNDEQQLQDETVQDWNEHNDHANDGDNVEEAQAEPIKLVEPTRESVRSELTRSVMMANGNWSIPEMEEHVKTLMESDYTRDKILAIVITDDGTLTPATMNAFNRLADALSGEIYPGAKVIRLRQRGNEFQIFRPLTRSELEDDAVNREYWKQHTLWSRSRKIDFAVGT
jgi:hypothetical protein